MSKTTQEWTDDEVDSGILQERIAILREKNGDLRRLAAEAQGEWELLPDGSYDDFTLTDNGKRVVIFISQEWGDESFRLDDDMRLQRHVVASEATGGDTDEANT